MSDEVDLKNLDLEGKIVSSEQITYGGFSDISRGTLLKDGTYIEVAIKSLRFHGHMSPEAKERLRKRFFREVLLWRTLQDLNIVPLLGYTMPSTGAPSMISPWYHGGNIIHYLQSSPNADRRDLALDVINGLKYLHSIPIAHGDIKGENVLVDANGRASLCDFGMSQFMDESSRIIGYTTTHAGLGGTDRFMCPELWNGEPKTAATDMWAVGCLIVQIFTDETPYHHLLTKPAVFSAIMRQEAPWTSRSDAVDTSLWDCVVRCWSILPNDRPGASEVGIRLELEKRWLKGEPTKSFLVGHGDNVYCLEFDSNKIITGSRDQTIKIWSLITNELLGTYSSHTGSVLCLKFDETGFMVSGSSDKTICVWQLTPKGDDALITKVLTGHKGGVLDLRMDKKWIVSGSQDTVIRIWDRVTMLPHCDLEGHEAAVNAVDLQGDKVISAGGDRKMILWDLLTRARLRTFEGHHGGLACVDFKGDYIISGSNDSKIKIWSASTGECLRTLSGHERLVRALSFDAESGRLVSASYDKTVKVWDWRTGKCLRDFRGNHDNKIFDVKFDASRIISSSHIEGIVVLDFGTDLDTSSFNR